jgi:hypothetical protein
MNRRLPVEPAASPRHEPTAARRRPAAPVAERLLALQRAAGNHAVTQMLGAGPMIQRSDHGASPTLRIGGEHTFRVGALRVSLVIDGSPLDEAKGDHASAKLGGTELQAVASKGKGLATVLATKLGSVAAGAKAPPPFDSLDVKLKLDALKSKLDFKDPGSSVSLAEVVVEISGALPDAALREFFGEQVAEALAGKVRIVGEYRYKIELDDLWNLHKSMRAVGEMTEQTEELGRKLDKLTDLQHERAALERKLKQTPPRGGTRKAQRARNAFENDQRRLRNLRKEIGEVEHGISRHKKLIAKAGRALAAAEDKIKSTAGHIAAKALGESGLMALKEIGEKFVPVANVLGAVQDMRDAAVVLVNIDDARLSLGGGIESPGGGEEPGGAEGGTVESGGGDEPTEGDVPGEGEPPIDISDNAAAIRDALSGSGGQAIWSNDDLARLDELAAPLDAEQLAAVLAMLEQMTAADGTRLESSDALFGALLKVIAGAKLGADSAEALRKNTVEQRILDFDPAQLTGRPMDAGSREFAQWTRAFQAEQGLKPDGVFGPDTYAAWHEANALSGAPGYTRAQRERSRRTKRAAKHRPSKAGAAPRAGGTVTDPDMRYVDDPGMYLSKDELGDRFLPNKATIEKARGVKVTDELGGEEQIVEVEVSEADEDEQRLMQVVIHIVVLRVGKGLEKYGVKPGTRGAVEWALRYTRADDSSSMAFTGKPLTGELLRSLSGSLDDARDL